MALNAFDLVSFLELGKGRRDHVTPKTCDSQTPSSHSLSSDRNKIT